MTPERGPTRNVVNSHTLPKLRRRFPAWNGRPHGTNCIMDHHGWALRSDCHRFRAIPVWRPAENGIEPWLNLTRAAKLLGHQPEDASDSPPKLALSTRYPVHPLADGPWIFRREDLEGAAAKTIVARAREGARHLRDLIPLNRIDRWAL